MALHFTTITTTTTTLMCHTRAGRRLPAGLLENLYLLVLKVARRMELFATHIARTASPESAQSVGKTAPTILNSEMTEHTATSLTHMVEAPVRSTRPSDVNSMEISGTSSAMKTSTTWAAACAHLIAL